jgi:anti-sigma-K factor RskA
MSAPTHTRPHPAPRGGVDIRLPWWALALPTLAFVVLLALILNPTDAQAATGGPAVAGLFEHLQQLISR